MDQDEATEIAKQLSDHEKYEFCNYDRCCRKDVRRLLAIASFVNNIGFNSSYFN